MCGRFAIRNRELQHQFTQFNWTAPGVAEALARPRYNVAPTQRVLAATNDPAHSRPTVELLRWGLVPSWSKDPKSGPPLINARAEGIGAKPTFRAAWKARRAVVFADGFVEWSKVGEAKVPHLFELAGGGAFAFAALWEVWTPREGGEPVRSCTVITTTPNELVARVHDRMPVILTPDRIDAWLNSASDLEASEQMLQALPAAQMRVTRVSEAVNNARNDTPEALAPAAAS